MTDSLLVDDRGDVWAPLPDGAPWSAAEGAFLVDGVPVMVSGDRYLVDA